jgi:hypothetical protein
LDIHFKAFALSLVGMLLNKECLFMYMSNITLLEPTSSGIGGDAFCLYYDSKKGTVKGLEGAGR